MESPRKYSFSVKYGKKLKGPKALLDSGLKDTQRFQMDSNLHNRIHPTFWKEENEPCMTARKP